MREGRCVLGGWEEPCVITAAELGPDHVTLRRVLESCNGRNHFQLKRGLQSARVVVRVKHPFEEFSAFSQIDNWHPVLRVVCICVPESSDLSYLAAHLCEDLESSRLSTLAIRLEVLEGVKRD